MVEKDIQWIRPKFINWVDSSGKTRYYFPDFYLVNHDIYLDPKNPFCMDKDKQKMEIISSKVKIIYGDIRLVKDYILNLI